jgi:hypothetical protein
VVLSCRDILVPLSINHSLSRQKPYFTESKINKTMVNNLQTHFSEVTQIIRQARYDALKKVNTELINLHWRIVQYISERTATDT